MERKIGEIFEHNGEWYQCADWAVNPCSKCDFDGEGICCDELPCTSSQRKDKKYVFFKKLEKVGEPFISGGKLYQHYKVFDIDNIDFTKCTNMNVHNYNKKTLTVEIKQNQEDMEEKKLNLKLFNIQKAREGKPVCTRDGRKARIVCFDAKGDQPIIALVEAKGNKDTLIEKVERYFINGHSVFEVRETNNDLMMLPEKHEGWLNIYKTGNDKFAALVGSDYLYKTEKEAKIEADPRVLATVKIEWEE